MPNMQATAQQVAAAAAAGVELLSDKDLKVPLGVAMGGQLSILHSMLSAIATGELVVVNAPPAGEQPGAPALEGIDGGKQEEGSQDEVS